METYGTLVQWENAFTTERMLLVPFPGAVLPEPEHPITRSFTKCPG